MDNDISFEISGVEELVQSLESLTRKYPDKAGDLLRKDGRELRKDIVKGARESTRTDSDNKKSLGKIGSYKVSQPQGIGTKQYVELSAKSPHFNLVEHGHNLVTKDGQTIGFVQGKHFMERATKAYEGQMEKHVSNMVDELLKEGGYT